MHLMAELKTRISLSILSAIFGALEREAMIENMDVTDIAERILETHTLNAGYLNPDEKEEISMYRSLIQRVINTAMQIAKEQGCKDTITADTIEVCMANAEWRADYTRYVGDDPYKNGNPKKQNINPSFGYWIKKSLGAKSKMKDGKPENRKVLGSIIQSYTPLEF
jgi:hypothetical protein